MKFFTRSHNPKANPLSKKMGDATAKMFEENGMTGTMNIAKCALAFFQATLRQTKEIESCMDKGHDVDKLLEKHADEFKTILASHGLVEVELQEKIILNYLDIVWNIGG